MSIAIGLARVIEKKCNLCNQSSKIQSTTQGLLGSQPSNSTPSTFKRLTPSEVKECKNRGLCYYCDGKYSPSHKCQSPQLFMMDDFHSKDDEEGSGQGAKHD